MAQFYAVHHGISGMVKISRRINGLAVFLAMSLETLGYKLVGNSQKIDFFGTVTILSDNDSKLTRILTDNDINVFVDTVSPDSLHNFDKETIEQYKSVISITLDETTTLKDLMNLLLNFAEANNKPIKYWKIMD